MTLIESTRLLLASLEREEVLRLDLDRSKEWYSIKRVALANNILWNELSWRKLVAEGVMAGKPHRKIFDANYGEVNTYHKDVWNSIYPDLTLPKEIK